MSNSKNLPNASPFHSKKCTRFRFISFWSKKIVDYIEDFRNIDPNSPVKYHDQFVKFINEECFTGTGKGNHRKRVKGSKHDDLTLPLKVIEFKLRSSALDALPSILRESKEIFKRNEYIYFGYFRKRRWKDESKDIKIQGCIYYLLVIIISKDIEGLNLRALLKDIKKEEMIFTKELAIKSGLDMDDEELYSIGNMRREILLEDKLEEKDELIKGKDKALEEKDKALEEKDLIIKQLKEQLKKS